MAFILPGKEASLGIPKDAAKRSKQFKRSKLPKRSNPKEARTQKKLPKSKPHRAPVQNLSDFFPLSLLLIFNQRMIILLLFCFIALVSPFNINIPKR